jgi:Tol biopolymer transport system component
MAAWASALLAAALLKVPAAAQYTTSSFGQNQVKLRDFDWQTKQTEHFTIFYYEDSAPWVEATAAALEDAYRRRTAELRISFAERRSFFLYANVNDMEQSSIVPVGDGTGGVTEPLKDRFMAYADGSRNWLDDVIHHEYGHVCQFRVLIDGFWRSARILKSIVYPVWFMEGMAEEGTGRDDITLENQVVRDRAVDDNLIPLLKLQALEHLKPHEVTTAYKEGSAAIRFLASQYGRDKIGELLKAFSSRFDASSALQDAIGTDLQTFDRKFREYAHDMFQREVEKKHLENARGRALTTTDAIPQFNTSPAFTPDGKSVVHLTTRDGFSGMVDMVDIETGEIHPIVGHEYAWVDTIPLGRFTDVSRNLSVSPDGRTTAFVGQKNHRDFIYLADLRTTTLSSLSFPGMMTIQEPAFSPDGKKIAFAGLKAGRSDIFLYDLESRSLENLTNTPDDDQSPAFSPDGTKIVWSQESGNMGWDPDWQRDLMMMDLKTKEVRRLTRMRGFARDPIFSPDGKTILFEADPDWVQDVYELNLETGKITRRTRSIGASFNPSYSPDGKSILYSSYRKNNVTIHLAKVSELLDEDATEWSRRPGAAPEPWVTLSTTPVLADSGPARFRFSSDIFLPAFFFSSQGGLFWTSYFQGSDYLGYHNVANFVNYNSGINYLNYSLEYAYTRFRPQWVFAGQGLMEDSVLDEKTGLDYNVKLYQELVGIQYPFDRFHRLELTGGIGSQVNYYTSITRTDHWETRSLTAGFVRDTVEGRYLVAIRGSRLALSYTQAFDALGGNQKFYSTSAEAHQFVPTGGQSALAFRTVGVFTTGPDAFNNNFLPVGGLGLVRGYQKYVNLSARAGTSIAYANAEWRFPIVQNLDYYLWFIFPDLYFKAVYGTFFYDIGYAWNSTGQLQSATWRDVGQSAGIGLRVFTFVLQRFELVLATDYAQQLTGRNHVMYIYLGPLF